MQTILTIKFLQLGGLWDGREATHSGFKSLLNKFVQKKVVQFTRNTFKSVTDLTCFRLQFPLSQRRKRRVLFTQAQVNAFCPLCTRYPITCTLGHRLISGTRYPVSDISDISDTRYLASDVRKPDSKCAWYLLSDMDTAYPCCTAYQVWWLREKYLPVLSSELEPFSFYLVLVVGLEVKHEQRCEIMAFCYFLLTCHIFVSAKLITFSSRFPAEGEKESFSLRHR